MVKTETISIQTKGETDIIDITREVAGKVASCGTSSGTVTVFVAGSTAGITTIEYEPGLIADLRALWDRVVPRYAEYEHNERWGDGNGYAHVRASVLGASLVVPFTNGRLVLGDWQQIVLVDFDNRPRSRKLILQILG
jgi:secondary thiamine-phosphate synthase enzyme